MTDIDRSIPFVDTHHHLWELDRFKYDWLEEPGWPGHNALLGDYKMIRSSIGRPERFFREFYGANVSKSVHVEAAYAGPDSVEETAWLDSVAKEYGFPNALVVFCDIEQDGAEAALERHLEASSLTRGVRIREHPDNADGEAFRAGYKTLARHDLSYELNASPGKLLSGLAVAQAIPEVQVILGHAGFPVQRDDDLLRAVEVRDDRAGRGRQRRLQGVRLRHGGQPLDGRVDPPVGPPLHRGLRARPDHVRHELAGRHPVRHLPRTNGRVSRDPRGRRVQSR